MTTAKEVAIFLMPCLFDENDELKWSLGHCDGCDKLHSYCSLCNSNSSCEEKQVYGSASYVSETPNGPRKVVFIEGTILPASRS